jgi:hypothetical protein
VIEFIQEKQYSSAPPKEWWLLAMLIFHFLKEVNITFQVLQVESGVVSKQYDNLRKLLDQLQHHCNAERDEERSLESPLSFSGGIVSQGQFSVTAAGISALLQGIGVQAAERAAQLDHTGMRRVLAASAVLYLESMNGLVKVIAGRQAAGHVSSAVPPCLPLELINTSVLDFVSLVTNHKAQLRSAFGEEFLKQVCDQHKELIRVAVEESPLRAQLLAKTRGVFSKAWSPCGSRFVALQMFSAGLVTVMPTTSRIEGDFSLMTYRRNSYCSALTDFALEGVMYAKQFQALQRVAALL